ncbi:MAG: hypothetical protein U0R77_05840 [Mycolicibacterium insubricum]|nr:hypothetical protein [Mycobacterium sp.]
MNNSKTHSPRTYWARALFGFLAISVAGNTAHALLTAPAELRWGSAVWAAVPPLILVVATEGLMRSAGRGVRTWPYRFGVGTAVLLGLGAFTVSFIALRDLTATLLQAPPLVAITMPLIIDAGIAVSGLMALSHTEPTAQVATVAAPAATPATPGQLVAVGAPTSGDDATVTSGDEVDNPVGTDPTEAFEELARQLVADGRVQAPVATVAAALAGVANGSSHRSVAAATGLHRATVAKAASLAGVAAA